MELNKEQFKLDMNIPTVKLRSWKDEVVHELVEGINKERIGTKWKPVTARAIAIRLNGHPTLGTNPTECYYLLSKCRDKGYKMFWWATKNELL